MSEQIDPRAVIAPGAKLGRNVTVGPYAIIGEDVTLGDDCIIGPHAVISGCTTIGRGTHVYTGANIGDEPQDLHFAGGRSFTDIGDDCQIREYVTIHRGVEDGSRTVIGNKVLLMAFSHIGHNCRIGDEVVVANATLLAGRVEVGYHAFISAQVMVHQFSRIGSYAMIGGGSAVGQDVPPFCMVIQSTVQGINAVGLRRAGWESKKRDIVHEAIAIVCNEGLSRPNAIAKIKSSLPEIPEILQFIEFLEKTRRGIMRGIEEQQG